MSEVPLYPCLHGNDESTAQWQITRGLTHIKAASIPLNTSASPSITAHFTALAIKPCLPAATPQGYLAHKKQRRPRTLQWDYAQGRFL